MSSRQVTKHFRKRRGPSHIDAWHQGGRWRNLEWHNALFTMRASSKVRHRHRTTYWAKSAIERQFTCHKAFGQLLPRSAAKYIATGEHGQRNG
jgi:hypothetical protein